MRGEARLEADRLLGEGKKRVDLSEYPELAWQLFRVHRDPTLVKEVTDRLEELKDSLCAKRDLIKEAEDPCRAAGLIARTTTTSHSLIGAFVNPPSVKDIPCFRVIEAAQGCPAEMCRDLVIFALEAEIYAIGLAQDEINEERDAKSEFFVRELEGYDTDDLIRLAFHDFYNSLDEGQFEVDLKDRAVLSFGARL